MVTVVPGVNFDRLGCRVGQEHLEGGQRRPRLHLDRCRRCAGERAGKDQRGGDDRCSDHSDRVRRDCGRVRVLRTGNVGLRLGPGTGPVAYAQRKSFTDDRS